ncbi:outer membrane lipoprotein-sorting protein [Hasllibacter halocynthiae]|uniref:Outer membrane lipoprotein-sorting protein n=1 Tax=Hasllibacter halocynthiae TaxID=595589 RepID=A0A2T0X1J5_9RHOB|nr:outer membrane lipoprotein carrier protein LolA [Hasllibacter halocynthiae]PRY92765.1 outer membrane lipoprotein-sorting protein [Hasllibacter halocynthiae]
MTNRRTILAGLLAAPLLALGAAPAAAEASLGEISQYFNSFRTAQGGFTQINDDQSISTGTVYIQRPGRVRFEYAPPERQLVVAGGGQVVILDARGNARGETYPLQETPLSIILQDTVDLSRAGMVTNHVSDGTLTTVTAQDPRHPEYGNIQLVFSENPVALRQWVVTNGNGERTTVILNDFATGMAHPTSRFSIDRARAEFAG